MGDNFMRFSNQVLPKVALRHSGVQTICGGMTCMAQQTSSCLSFFFLKHVFLLLLHNGNQGTLCPAFKLFELLCHVPPQVPICFLGGHIDDSFTLQSIGN